MPSSMVALDQSSVDRHEAIANFIDDIEFRRDVEAGLADVANGNVKPDCEVEAYFAAKRNSQY